MRRVASIGALKELGKKKEYTVRDLFYASWDELTGKQQVEVYTLWLRLKSVDNGQLTMDNGNAFLMIQILRILRKNHALVNEINETQALDCFNELKEFLDKPWFEFRFKIQDSRLRTPDEKMARTTFEHFIYADNEFSKFLIDSKPEYLTRLVATLYQKEFDAEEVEPIAKKMNVKEWQLMHTFYTYKHIREAVVKRCKTLLPTQESPPLDLPQGGETAKPVPTGAMWQKLLHRLSETPAFPGMESARKARMYAALDYLEDVAQQRERSKLNG